MAPSTKTPKSPKPKSPASGARTAARNAARAAAALSAATDPLPPVDQPGDDLKMKDLLAAVAGDSALKRAEVKTVIEDTLRHIGAAMADGRQVNLPGLGKVKVKRSKVNGANRIIEARVRQDVNAEKVEIPGASGLANPDECG